MKNGWVLAGCVMAFGLGGCISDRPHYDAPVIAAPLRYVPPPQPETSFAALAAVEPPATPERPAPSPPKRTEVKGVGDGAQNPDRVVVKPKKEIEHRIADFSAEQVASMVCRAQGSQDPAHIARGVRGWEATTAFTQARADFNAGTIGLSSYDKAEKARQDAMLAFRGNGFLEGLFGARFKKKDLPKPESGQLIIENLDVFTFNENGAPVMAVSGVVRNRGSVAAEVPPITLQSIDAWTWLLAGQTSLLDVETLDPGESKAFEIRFLNPPETTFEVYAHFAPPFEFRARRNCGDDFDPRQAKPLEPYAVLADSGPVHTVAELNALNRFYRDEAESAWICRNGPEGVPDQGAGLHIALNGSGERREGGSIMLGKPNVERLCASSQQRLRWRDMFVLGETTEEAWAALQVREDAERKAASGGSSSAVAEANAAFERAYGLVTSLGGAALARAGGTAPNLDVTISSSSFGNGGGFYYLDVAGTVRNTGSEARKMDALMLALVDRLDMPLVTLAIDMPKTLAPGETASFAHRIRLNSAPLNSGPWGTAPGWQVRVGAMGK